jgi:opacity protein-like surface antigen
MKKINFAAIAAVLTGIGAPAMAQDSTGAYAGLRLGVSMADDVDLSYEDGEDTVDFSAQVDNAATLGGVIGYDFGMVRADLEVDYNRNKVSGLTVIGVNGEPVTLDEDDIEDICDYLEMDSCDGTGNTITTDGRLRSLSAMANIWLDIPAGETFVPYVGGGVGIGGYEMDGEGKTAFAWQLGAGAAFNLSPSAAITIDFRHRQISGATIEDEEFPDFRTRIGNVKTNTISAGLRFRF